MKFLILGASGMAGHTIAVYLTEQGHNVVAFTRKHFEYCKQNILGDASDLKMLEGIILDGDYDVVVNCIGVLNNFAEENKASAVMLNSFLPHHLSSIIKDCKTRLIQMSTDCVFSGITGSYIEDAFQDGRSFYDRSKALGEVIDGVNLTFRNSIVGPDMNEDGIGLFNWFLKQNGEIKGFTKVIWTGVTTLTLAKAIETAAQQNLTGIFHLVNNSTISKYDLLSLFNKYFKDNNLRIIPDNNIKVDKSLINTRNDFGFIIPSYEDMIVQMYHWIYDHKQLYPHYFK